VQAAVREQTKNATLVGLSIEKEKGKTLYEIERISAMLRATGDLRALSRPRFPRGWLLKPCRL